MYQNSNFASTTKRHLFSCLSKVSKPVAMFLVFVMILATQMHSPLLVRAATRTVVQWGGVNVTEFNVSEHIYLHHVFNTEGDVFAGIALDPRYGGDWDSRRFFVTSTDMVDWEIRSRFFSLVYNGNGRFFGVQPSGLYTTDLSLNWQRADLPAGVIPTGITERDGVLRLQYRLGDSPEQHVMLSIDGNTWFDYRGYLPESAMLHNVFVKDQSDLITVTFDNGRLRVLESEGFTENTNWTEIQSLTRTVNTAVSEFWLNQVWMSNYMVAVSLYARPAQGINWGDWDCPHRYGIVLASADFQNWHETHWENRMFAPNTYPWEGVLVPTNMDVPGVDWNWDYRVGFFQRHAGRAYVRDVDVNISQFGFYEGAIRQHVFGFDRGIPLGSDGTRLVGTLFDAGSPVFWSWQHEIDWVWSDDWSSVQLYADGYPVPGNFQWGNGLYSMVYVLLPGATQATLTRILINGQVVSRTIPPGGLLPPDFVPPLHQFREPIVFEPVVQVTQPVQEAAQDEDGEVPDDTEADYVPSQPLPEEYEPPVPLPEFLPPEDVLVYVLDDDLIEEILLSAYEYGYAVIDLYDTEAAGIDLPASLFEDLAGKEATLAINLPSGTLELCPELVQEIADQAESGDRVVLFLYMYQDGEIIEEVLELLCYGDEVFNVRLLVGGEAVTEIEGRLAVTVTHDGSPLPGVWRIGPYGDFYPQEFDVEEGQVTFFPDRLSNFVVGYSAYARTIAIFRADGEFSTLHSRGRETTNLREGQRLSSGDRLTTGANSQVFVMMDGSSIIKLGENSEIEITEAGRNLEINVIIGSVLVRVDSQEPHHATTVRAQNTTTGVRGTMFTVSVDLYGNETVSMLSGHAEVNGEPLKAGYMLVLAFDAEYGNVEFAIEPISIETIDDFTLAAIVSNFDYLVEHLEIDLTDVDIELHPLPTLYEIENLIIEDFDADCDDDCLPVMEPDGIHAPQDGRRC